MALGVDTGVSVGLGVGVDVAVGELAGNGVAVGAGVSSAEGLAIAVDVAVGVGVADGAGVGVDSLLGRLVSTPELTTTAAKPIDTISRNTAVVAKNWFLDCAKIKNP
jgi:hypothetical protein